MTTNDKGNYAEMRAASLFTRAGMIVCKPLCDHSRYDLIVDDGESLRKVQVKGKTPYKGALRVRVYSNKPTASGPKYSPYSGDDVDLYAIVDLETEKVYLVPREDVEGVATEFSLRLEGAANGQSSGVRMASDYEFILPL